MTDRTSATAFGRIAQFVKYCLVGVLNTLITMGVIYLCKSFLGWNIYLSNFLGYAAGILNSFFCNRSWVFESDGRVSPQLVRFLCGAGLCYLIQLWAVWMVTNSPVGEFDYCFHRIVISGYGIATVLGNIVYTLAFFVYNRLVTFR
ncbi:MAG: GtrA family protein [Muribaculaceae bacterium]|nr:GtrA family protein [Muribaculaceae bacterium]